MQFIKLISIDDTFPETDPFKTWLHIPECTASDESRDWVARELENCAKHALCNTTAEPHLPTRVLDLNYDIDHVPVTETNHGDTGKYYALSHCWGDPAYMTTKLTVHTRNDLKAGKIPLKSLPRTFRDAISFTRKMGVRYLWIDSLCILQRDFEKDNESDREFVEKDWQQESSKMCLVYQNSYITLAAAASEGCQGGLFYTNRKFKLEEKRNDESSYHFVIRKMTDHYQRLPLIQRGWSFQERLLSPRTLYFTEDELYWQCDCIVNHTSTKTCQCTGIESIFIDVRFLKIAAGIKSRDTSFLWHKLVESYSATNLSYQSDKLTAIDGLAQYFTAQGKHDYLAGLWTDFLWIGLLWRVKSVDGVRRTEQTNPPPIKNRWSSRDWLFPTWSWASISGSVSWGNISRFYELDLSQPPWHRRQATTGRQYELHLSGVLVPIKLKDLEGLHDETNHLFDEKESNGRFYPDYQYSLYEDGERGHVNRDSTVYCLRMKPCYTPGLGQNCYMSLVLHCVQEAGQVYDRIGFVSCLGGTNGRRCWWGDEDGLEVKDFILT